METAATLNDDITTTTDTDKDIHVTIGDLDRCDVSLMIHSFTRCRQIEKLKKCELITEAEVKALCAKAREILAEEGNVQVVDAPVTVCFYLIT